MRTALVTIGLLAFGATGAAHAVECYASEWDEKIGDVTQTYELDAAGKITRNTLTFTPERVDGQESTFFSRPQLMLDFSLTEAGVLEGPSNAEMLVSRVTSGGKSGPTLSEMKVRATMPGAEPMSWEWSGQANGQKLLAQALRDTKPAKLTLQLIDKTDKVVAGSAWGLPTLEKLTPLAVKAKAGADKKVAAFQKAAEGGAPPKSCPAG